MTNVKLKKTAKHVTNTKVEWYI